MTRMIEPYLSPAEVDTLGKLVNNFGILGSQLIQRSRPDWHRSAFANLQRVKASDEPLVRRVDQLARISGDEGALRLIEDLEKSPEDTLQCLTLARRCLLASAFLGHCIATIRPRQTCRSLVHPQPATLQ